MNCQSFREQILELILPGGDARRRLELTAHADGCPACAQYLAEMTRTLNALQPSFEIKATSNFKERVMKNIAESERSEMGSPRPKRRWLWRLGLAATLLIAVGLAALLGNNPKSGAAWALEKTIEAYRSVQFIHMKFEPTSFGSCSERWAQFDEHGKLLSLRSNFPDTEDGPKVVVWHADKAEIWFKKKGAVTTVREPNFLKRIKMSINDFDPRLIVESLFQKEKQGKATAKANATITTNGQTVLVMSVTYKDAPGIREVYHLDTATQLVTQIDRYQTRKGKEELSGRTYYLDYNKPEVAAVFKIEAPADVMRVDQATQDVGLVKGNLSDNEMATKVAREFFEALIAKDYDQAGRILGGMPGAALKKTLEGSGEIRFLRIVSMEAPRPHPIPGTRGIQVPCKIEIEVNGTKAIQEFKLGVRAVYNRPDRWNVFGGF